MKALLLIDLQNDFMPGGALPVPAGDEIIEPINKWMERFQGGLIIASQDWHPKDHVSFAANHSGKMVGDTVVIEGVSQILWPIHCVQYSWGAELVSSLHKGLISSTFYKGTDRSIDSYSAFFDNAKKRKTGLEDHLHMHKVDELFVAGVATDYCVQYSVLDALSLGFKVTVITSCCRGINAQRGDVEKALASMKEKGAVLSV